MAVEQTPQNVWNLWRCTLCDHGTNCAMHRRRKCGYAHSLKELMPPNETVVIYNGMWTDGVDRFYGQQMPEYQLDRIRRYWNMTLECEKPTWARCLAWLHGEHALDAFPHCSWDFGIWQDLESLRVTRKEYTLPFSWAVRRDGARLWDLLYQRWHALRSPTAQVLPLPSFVDDGMLAAAGTADNEGHDAVAEGSP